MAKKKMTHQENQQENNLKQHQHQEPKAASTAMDEASSQKLESLKSLNTRLLKEAVERRQLVDSLMHAKGSLESELTRSNSEKEMFQSELTQLSEEAVRHEVERDLMFDFVGVQVGQQAEVVERERDEFWRDKAEIEKKMKRLEEEIDQVLSEKSEIERAKSEKDSEIKALNEKLKELVNEIDKERSVSERFSREREELMAKLEVETEEVKGLKMKLLDTENREEGIKEEVEELAINYKGVVEEKEERERRIEMITKEKDSIEERLMETNRVINEMKGKIEMISEEKEGIEEERDLEKMKRSELESTVSGLNEMVLSLKHEEERLRGNVAELEKNCVEGVEREKVLGKEIDELIEEKNVREKELEKLVEEKGLVEKDLDETLRQLNEEKQKIARLVNEKKDLAEDKERKESEIVELQKKVDEFEDAIKELENSCEVQLEKINSLESAIVSYKDALKQVTVERDEARKGYEEEKLNGLALKEKIVEMEKSIEKYLRLVEEMKAENANIVGEKEELETLCEMLKEEISSTDNTLSEVQKQFDALRGKVELANADSARVLNLLRGTAELVCKKEEGVNDVNEKQMNGRETEPYVTELELIKNAFKSKESKVEDMARQLELLHNSVAEAHKKKSFWTLLSSAATVFAAVSLAYIARGH